MPMTFEDVKLATAMRFRITVADMEGPSRKAKYTRPRMLAMFICRNVLGASTPSIGVAFGDRDHTTVMNAERRMTYLIACPPPGFDYAQDMIAILGVAMELNVR